MPAMKTTILLSLLFLLSCQAENTSSIHRAPSQEGTVIPAEEEATPVPEEAKGKRPVNQADELPARTREFMDLVNEHREKLGLEALAYSKEIEETAEMHSRRMAQKKIPFGHVGSKLRCRNVIQALEVDSGTLCGENVAMGQEDAQEVFSAWMNSPSHREAIEDGRFTHSGLGYYQDFRGRWYWTQIFLKIN